MEQGRDGRSVDELWVGVGSMCLLMVELNKEISGVLWGQMETSDGAWAEVGIILVGAYMSLLG